MNTYVYACIFVWFCDRRYTQDDMCSLSDQILSANAYMHTYTLTCLCESEASDGVRTHTSIYTNTYTLTYEYSYICMI